MHFLEHLSAADMERLMAESAVVALEPGEHLIRRGTEGGDIYLVEAGRLEVVDARKRPEMIMDVLGPGRVVGEMAFVDQAPRAADVRAVESATVRRWVREDLLRLLNGDDSLASRFFWALSASTIGRLRVTDQLAAGFSVGQGHAAGLGVNAAVAEAARGMAQGPRTRWGSVEAALKGEGGQPKQVDEIAAGLHDLVDGLNGWLSSMNSISRAQEAGGLLRGELRHWLVRARTGVLGVDGRRDQAARLSFLAHLIRHRAEGTDTFGEHLDAAVLALPTPTALRGRLIRAVDEAVKLLPTDRCAEIVLLEPACGALLARLMPRVVGQGARIHCLDGDPQTLAFADAGLQARPTNISLNMVHQDLVALLDRPGEVELPSADAILLNGLVDYLPARLVTGLLEWCRTRLVDGGGVVLTGLAPTPDARFMEHMLGWPTMRRTAGELVDLFAASGFDAVTPQPTADSDAAGLVLVGRVSTSGQS